jgi:tetratricopeptide (TPR) repeat protein
MKPLPHPNNRHLEAAQGWLGLGDVLAANEELEQIEPELRAYPGVLWVRYQIYSKAKKWNLATEIAATLTEQLPNDPAFWISYAYATRRKEGGGIQEAKTILIKAKALFPKHYLIAYNLACYECQLGNLKEAMEFLGSAIDLAKENDIRSRALDDPDLEPLWAKISEI